MSCQTLEVGLAQSENPSGMLEAAATPQAGEVCRSYDFGGTQWLVAIGPGAVIYSIGGIPLKAIQ